MYECLGIFLVTYFFIATEKIDKTIAALLGAAAVILFHFAPYEELLHKVDLNVIFLLVGMMMIVNILSVTGIFEWIAITIAQLAKGNGAIILMMFLVATAVLSAILDNVTTVILIAPVTILISEILEIEAVPILMLEALFSNIGGTSTLVGDPPNIIIGSQTDLVFNDFIFNLGPVVVVIMIISLGAVFVLTRKRLTVSPNVFSRIMKAKPEKAIINPFVLKRAGVVFLLVLLGFFLSRLFEIEPGIVALAGGILMALVCKQNLHHVLEKVEWGTIFFFIGLFMLIGSLEHTGVFHMLGQWVTAATKGNLLITALVILWVSAIASAVVDNIPLVISMIPIIKTIVPVFAEEMEIVSPELVKAGIEYPLFWALALGACLGGNGTLIGASANVVIAQIARRNRYKLSFWDFTKYGLPLMFLSLLISTVYLYLFYFQ